jgi:hypothetical protein
MDDTEGRRPDKGYGTLRSCPHCTKGICVECRVAWEWCGEDGSVAQSLTHSALTCTAYCEALREIREADKLLPPGHKRCPGCNVDVYRPRLDQCHDVTCDKCKLSYCYVCLRKTDTTSHGCPQYCAPECDCVPEEEASAQKEARLTIYRTAVAAKKAAGWHGPRRVAVGRDTVINPSGAGADSPQQQQVPLYVMVEHSLHNKDACTLRRILAEGDIAGLLSGRFKWRYRVLPTIFSLLFEEAESRYQSQGGAHCGASGSSTRQTSALHVPAWLDSSSDGVLYDLSRVFPVDTGDEEALRLLADCGGVISSQPASFTAWAGPLKSAQICFSAMLMC